jgi:hypothetical protein
MGDLNIHVDRPDTPVVAKFLSTLVSFGLTQHVVNATHIDGHSFDLVITRSSDDFITVCPSDCGKSTNSWIIRNKLRLNAGKTEILIASSARSRKFKPVPSPLDICDEPITPSPFVKNLGVMVDSHLNMERQVNTVCRNAYYHLCRISRIRNFLYAGAWNQLVCALVIPNLDYGNSLLAFRITFLTNYN